MLLCTYIVYLFQNCVTQIFDTREVMVTQNTTLAEEFNTNIKLFLQSIDLKIGEHAGVHTCTCICICTCVCACLSVACTCTLECY